MIAIELRFSKFEALGNDFILIDARTTNATVSAELCIALCNRHRGIGADGVLTLLKSRTPTAHVYMQVTNADGSLARACGNGLRCVVRFLESERRRVVVDTDSGDREGFVTPSGSVYVTMGEPVLRDAATKLVLPGFHVVGAVVDVGNPHFVVRSMHSESEATGAWTTDRAFIAGAIERHPAFVDGTNVEFVDRHGDTLEVAVFERGVGFTLACGSGAVAAVVAARAWGQVRADVPVRVRMPGGTLVVRAHTTREVAIEGAASRVFDGEFDPSVVMAS